MGMNETDVKIKPEVHNFCLPLLAVRVITQTLSMSLEQTPDSFYVSWSTPW